MSHTLATIRQRARGRDLRILLPESSDARILEAAATMAEQGIGIPWLIWPEKSAQIDIPGVFVHPTDDSVLRQQCLDYLAPRVPDPVAALGSPLMLAAALLGLGRVDAVIAGCAHTSADVLRAAIRGVGVDDPERFVSTRLLMILSDRALTYGDCAMNPEPSAEQLATIAIRCADGHRTLTGEEPLVALLSFSTLGSAQHERVENVRRAVGLARLRRPDLMIDGELQFDAALNQSVAARKAAGSEVAGRANVLVFPNLEAANIGCKITEFLAGARMLGPYTEGLQRPFVDLSRSCHVNDIVDLAAVLCCTIPGRSQPPTKSARWAAKVKRGGTGNSTDTTGHN
jgi:phosphotransacetylase